MIKSIKPHQLILIAICALAVALYANAINVPYYLDDKNFVNQSLPLAQLSNLVGAVNSRIVATLSFQVEIPWLNTLQSAHAISITIHIFNAALVYLLCKKLNINKLAAVVVAAVFLLHPLNSQAVIYLSQRAVLLSCFFTLLSVLLFYNLLNAKHLIIKTTYLIASCCFLILAVLSKQTAVFIPLFLYLVVFIEKPVSRKPMAWLALFLLMALTALLITAPGLLNYIDTVTRETQTLTRSDYFATQQYVWQLYIQKFYLPFNLSLESDIDIIKYGSREFWLRLAANAATIMAIAMIAYRHKNKQLATMLGLFLTSMLVESTIIPIEDVHFEHRMYIPSIALILITMNIIQCLGKEYFKRQNTTKITIIVSTLLVVIMTSLTYQRIQLWLDPQRFYEYEYSLHPNSSRVLDSLAALNANAGNKRQALEFATKSYNLALERNKITVTNLTNLLTLLNETGQHQHAVGLGTKLLTRFRQPQLREVIYSRVGRAYALSGMCGFGVGWSKQALKINSDNTYAKETLSKVCKK